MNKDMVYIGGGQLGYGGGTNYSGSTSAQTPCYNATPCMCCDQDFEETEDTYCQVCGEDCCESCLEGHVCSDCRQKHHTDFLRNEEWQKTTDEEREARIRQAL